ncbi:GNAT family N-acetyltransferase [Actinocorallia sp. B10E7]|uniref:GNAT family N-acetyltransferase n=1 Tax=Actinocorallia sp. B10E7 TaxID=3153558 RepID=UPI00325EBD4D
MTVLIEPPISPPSATVSMRPLAASDQRAVAAMHARCSVNSRRMRYFSAKPGLPQRLFDLFLERSRGLTLVVESTEGDVVALGHLMYLSRPGAAELAFLVEDGWQGRGLGRALAERMVDLGRREGLRELRASVLSENARMRRLLTSLGGRAGRTEDPSVLEIVIALEEAAAAA